LKTSLKAIAGTMKPGPVAAPSPTPVAPDKPYRVAETRAATRQLSGHFPADDVQAFRVLAATLDVDVQELLAECINMGFERHGLPNRINLTSGRRKRVGS
jgi:hypothetical protein